MATDSAAQRTSVFVNNYRKRVPEVIALGDSIMGRYAALANLSNYEHRLYTNTYLSTQAVGGTLFADYQGADAPTIALKPYSFIKMSEVLSPDIASPPNFVDLTNLGALLVWGGYNDQNKNTPLGTSGTSDITTFEGAIRQGVANYRARKPEIKILFITPNQNPVTLNNSLGLNLVDYRNRMISVCATLGIPCLDIYSVPVDAADVPDNVHPTNAWLEARVPLIGQFVLDNL